MRNRYLWLKLTLAFAILLQNYAFSQRNSKLEKWGVNIGLNWCNWAAVPAGLQLKPVRNYGFDGALLRHFSLVKRLKLSAGLGISSVNIHNNAVQWSSAFTPDGNIYSSHLWNPSAYRRNKLSLTYVEIPLELSFRLGGESSRTFRIAAGFNGGVLIDAHTKTVLDSMTTKTKDFHNINRFRYGPTLRLSVGRLGIYGRYDLSSSFDAPHVPVYNVYTVGLMYSGS